MRAAVSVLFVFFSVFVFVLFPVLLHDQVSFTFTLHLLDCEVAQLGSVGLQEGGGGVGCGAVSVHSARGSDGT